MIRVALSHRSVYSYDRRIELGPQVVRLRPAPHCRTPIASYSLGVQPEQHFVNWQQDVHSNFLARLVFPEPTDRFEVDVDLIAEMTVINPFDFFLEPDATEFPFQYDSSLAKDLRPFLEVAETGPCLEAWMRSVDRSPIRTIDFLVALNSRLQDEIAYLIRMEPGVQTAEETLTLGSGSCRDSAWLLVEILRRLGLAARFVSGYLIQLAADEKSLDGPSGPEQDFTDLHAWTEVYLPGAGWIGLDPTSGLLAGEGHIPLACTPDPTSAAPISGTVGLSSVEFEHSMSVTRIAETPRVTKPYRPEEWTRIYQVGQQVDARLRAGDVRLTMGGEPTFVSRDDADAAEWTTAAVGPTKRRFASDLVSRLRTRFAPGGLIHYGQGKWYPGESLPRWAWTCLWRSDMEPLWRDAQLLATPDESYGHDTEDARRFTTEVAERLGVDAADISSAHEDQLYLLWKEQRLPVNADLRGKDTHLSEERRRIVRMLERGPQLPVGSVLPLRHEWWKSAAPWVSGGWPLRSDLLFLIPGDSPMGLRLPLDSLPEGADEELYQVIPFHEPERLPSAEAIHLQYERQLDRLDVRHQELAAARATRDGSRGDDRTGESRTGNGRTGYASNAGASGQWFGPNQPDPADIIRTAMCVEPRNGTLHVFLPPVERLESYLELLAVVEQSSAQLGLPVVVEGYLPPSDARLRHIKVTPDPGVIEVNVHPAHSWDELVEITSGLYEDAKHTRLSPEKFDMDGTHTGTGGGNHFVLGGSTPSDSPFLRNPALLRSLVGYWHNHPSLSYLFSGKFIGPTSQAPRVDEGRRDAAYELQIAFEQIPETGACPPWLVDRVFRNLLVDLTGNTHRAEFCIDKLFSPDSATGRLGLVEFRGFEMPPHWQMSLTQQLLLRALVARFWDEPYTSPLADWNTSIHDVWMLPHYLSEDLSDVVSDLQDSGISFEESWFDAHFEFRFPRIGTFEKRGLRVELRSAAEPWYVLGEEPVAGTTARHVDSSVERLQVKVNGLYGDRYAVTCNGRRVPLHPTGTEGEFAAGVRYRAWQPPSCLHPTIPVDEPLVFNVLDCANQRSVGGCSYHIGHPGGLNPDIFPVNAYEAESRRGARFSQLKHTGGRTPIPAVEPNASFPMTLDLRKNRGPE